MDWLCASVSPQLSHPYCSLTFWGQGSMQLHSGQVGQALL